MVMDYRIKIITDQDSNYSTIKFPMFRPLKVYLFSDIVSSTPPLSLSLNTFLSLSISLTVSLSVSIFHGDPGQKRFSVILAFSLPITHYFGLSTVHHFLSPSSIHLPVRFSIILSLVLSRLVLSLTLSLSSHYHFLYPIFPYFLSLSSFLFSFLISFQFFLILSSHYHFLYPISSHIF